MREWIQNKIKVLGGDWMTCMYDRDDECFEDCPGCPRAAGEPDPDDLRDYYMDDELEDE